ncbi:uncharacterized protein LOC124298541 isoform X1 [Neodiprion virginianus]|uniref:uncharacterized protein LOC124298541 isoform X1 n=2 Tax=Neodiprion virginianus TaxID=2961670 RepID=UPI001EE69E08|nr:uncharacterized protein LOC124298541 isoform X1 [Neodiprion virginianus]
MHAGVFRPRISEEAFQILLDVMESNFAALRLPADTNQSTKNSSKRRKLPALTQQRSCGQNCVLAAYCYAPIIDQSFLRFAHLATSGSREEFGAVFQVILPLPRTVKSITSRATMRITKPLDESQEPMEIEEISYTEPSIPVVILDPSAIKTEKLDEEETEPSNVRPKVILRESKLSNIQEGPSTGREAAEVEEVAEAKEPAAEGLTRSDAYQRTKSTLRSLVRSKEVAATETQGRKTRFYYFWQTIFFVLFPIALIVAGVTISRDESYDLDCVQRFDPAETIRELENRVFGQAKAVQELGVQLTTLESSRFKIVVLIGGTGIGKSYAAHIISENFPARRNVFHYIPRLQPMERYAWELSSDCGCNLIVIENLSNRDIADASDFAARLASRVAQGNYCLLILQVINVHEIHDDLKHTVDLARSTKEIQDYYKSKNLNVNVVTFEPLSSDDVDRCIAEAAKERKLTLSADEIRRVRLGLEIAGSGCKGAYAKVQLFDKKIDV